MKFLKKYFESSTKRSEIWAFCSSSWFLARVMVKEEEVRQANVIVELWAWTGVFSREIFRFSEGMKKDIFIIEKDRDFYEVLVKKFPEHTHNIIHADVSEWEKILRERWIEKVDLVISSLPFQSLWKDVLTSVLNHFLGSFFDTKSIFKQFSYIPSTKNYVNHFLHIQKDFCLLNFPPATVFTCTGYKR